MLARIGSIDTSYWGDRLEVNVDLAVKEFGDSATVEAWVDQLAMRPRQLLAEHLEIDANLGVEETRRAILAHRDRLLPLRLVEDATFGKRTYAILKVAKAKLSAESLDRCRVGADKFDRLALMWLLYLDDPENLELVFHLDRTQRKGFARMVLADAPSPSAASVESFFTRPHIQGLLNDFEKQHETLRESHCASVIEHDGIHQVFIKRDGKSDFVSHGPKNVFGFSREWIVLEFEPGLERVRISSVSPKEPLQLANALAGAFFGEAVSYEDETIVTAVETVEAFLQKLVKEPARLRLVEFASNNSPLDGSPKLQLSSDENETLAPAIEHITRALGDPLHAKDIDSIKVFAHDKRVKMIFEPIDEGDGFVVRYADQPLNSEQRQQFEERMRTDYGISVLSTEKKTHGE